MTHLNAQDTKVPSCVCAPKLKVNFAKRLMCAKECTFRSDHMELIFSKSCSSVIGCTETSSRLGKYIKFHLFQWNHNLFI